MNGTRRSSIALAAAALLTASGAAVVAQGTAPDPAPPEASSTPATGTTADPRTAELERSVDALLTTVSGLEAAVAASDSPDATVPTDGDAFRRSAVVGDRVTERATDDSTDDSAGPEPAETADAAPTPAPIAEPVTAYSDDEDRDRAEDEHQAGAEEDGHEPAGEPDPGSADD